MLNNVHTCGRPGLKHLKDFRSNHNSSAEEHYGLKMNLSNTKDMWIGKNRNSLETTLGLASRMVFLGIHFSCDQEQVIQQNFHDRLTESQKFTNLWKLRGLFLFGKVAILIKSFLLPNYYIFFQ